jgi:hypothetical protein
VGEHVWRLFDITHEGWTVYQQVELPLNLDEQEHERARAQPTLDERFEDFHATHPWVLEALEDVTTRWIKAGGGRIGVKALFEQLRWERATTHSGEPLHLNNNFTSRYARLLCERHPEWCEVFELRRLRTLGHTEDHSTLDETDQVK